MLLTATYKWDQLNFSVYDAQQFHFGIKVWLRSQYNILSNLSTLAVGLQMKEIFRKAAVYFGDWCHAQISQKTV